MVFRSDQDFESRRLLEDAIVACIRHYHIHKNQNIHLCWDTCVKHTNATFLRNYPTLNISRRAVTRYRTRAFARTPTPYSMGCYMYFQETIHGSHSLARCKGGKSKSRAHLTPKDLPLISREIVILPDSRYSYVVRSLHKRPHGSELLKLWRVSDAILQKHKIHTTTIVTADKKQAINMVSSFGLVVLPANCPRMKSIPKFALGEEVLLKNILYKSGGQIVDQERAESGTNHVNVRLRMGFGQAQPKTNDAYRGFCLKTKKVLSKMDVTRKGNGYNDKNVVGLPTMNISQFKTLSKPAQNFLMNVAELGTDVTYKYYGKKSFDDPLRQTLFSAELFSALGYRGLLAYWEYIDIVVTSCCTRLRRHMDYEDDSRENFDHTYVYSFFKILDGVEYKVSIIMTTRCDVGSAMDNIRSRV